MAKVLIISQKLDPHIEMVAKYLDDEPIVYDPEQDFRINPLTYHFNGTKLNIKYGKHKLEDVTAIWYRKPNYINGQELKALGINISKEYEEYCLSANTAHVKAIYELLQDKLWISKVPSIRTGQNKLLQYEIASKLGLKIPETVITNDLSEAATFIKKHNNNVVMKGLFNVPVLTEYGKKSLLYTLSFRNNEIGHLENLNICPYIFQQEIIPKIDLRVTVVEDEVFACQIKFDEKLNEESIDWRIYSNREKVLNYTNISIPMNVEQACIQLVRDMDLKYGAIDFALKDDQYWFLEINPNGQWGFQEDGVSEQIARKIAKVLNSSN